MDDNNILKESEIQQQLTQLKLFENELTLQLDNLATKLPEIYSGYADLVRETFAAAFDIIAISPDKTEKIGLAVEVFSRGIEAYGAYKAAKEHNKQLDRYLRIKQEFANMNQSKIHKLNREIQKKISGSERLFDKFVSMQFDFSNKSEDIIVRQANLALRYLTLYRTNLFLLDLSKYLLEEYGAWSQGKQTSEMEKPDYYDVNAFLLNKLYGVDNGFEILESICDQENTFTGADLILLSDPQLSLYSMQNILCNIHIEEASPVVQVLINNNPAFQQYAELTYDIKSHVQEDPVLKIWGACVIGAIVTTLIILFYFPSENYKWWVLIISLLAIFRIGRKNSMNAKIKHVLIGEQKTDEADASILQLCGYVEVDEIDYERKDTTSEFIKGFLKL